MWEERKHCHSLGSRKRESVCVCCFPSLPSHFLKNRQEFERARRMWLIFLALPFLHCKLLNRPKRVNCFFKFYQQEGSPAELQFSAQRLPSCFQEAFRPENKQIYIWRGATPPPHGTEFAFCGCNSSP